MCCKSELSLTFSFVSPISVNVQPVSTNTSTRSSLAVEQADTSRHLRLTESKSNAEKHDGDKQTDGQTRSERETRQTDRIDRQCAVCVSSQAWLIEMDTHENPLSTQFNTSPPPPSPPPSLQIVSVSPKNSLLKRKWPTKWILHRRAMKRPDAVNTKTCS